jgi:hypothetical protein
MTAEFIFQWAISLVDHQVAQGVAPCIALAQAGLAMNVMEALIKSSALSLQFNSNFLAFYLGLCSYYLMELPLPRTTVDRIAAALEGLCRAVAARIAGGALPAALIVLVWGRVQRAKRDISRLLARFQAQAWIRRRPALPAGPVQRGSVGLGRGDRQILVRPVALPRGFAWLLPLVPGEAACFAGQVQAVLGDADMVALLAASPQARRVMRPICRMLGIDASVLREPARVRLLRSEAPRAAQATVRVPHVAVDWGRVALPRGVLTAARKAGFAKRRADLP